MLRTAPKIIANIEYFGLLSERTIGLVLIEISKNGIPKEVIPANVIAYSKISSVDPNAYIRGFKNICTKIVIIIPIINNEDTAVPTTDLAFSGFPRPNSRLKLEAAPIPIIKPIAKQIVVRGKATFVAALPKYPTPCPIKIWSITLYIALIILAVIAGQANDISNFFIGFVPSGFSI